ncbi:MAG: hypothetical protein AAFV88_17910, partial [Planctomycetota bacterium]
MPNRRRTHRWTRSITRPNSLNRMLPIQVGVICLSLVSSFGLVSNSFADQAVAVDTSWEPLSGEDLTAFVQGALDSSGAAPSVVVETVDRFRNDIESLGRDPLDALIDAIGEIADSVKSISDLTRTDPLSAAASIDPSEANYAELEALPIAIRMSVRTWMGRELVRGRFYDEALPVIAEVDAAQSIDPASALFYR